MMRRSLYTPTMWLMLFSLVATPMLYGQDTANGDQKNAADLIQNTGRSIGYIIKMALESKDPMLAASNEEAEPFWQALKKANGAVDKAERGLLLKDETFFTALADLTSGVEELKITYGMSKARDATIQEGIEKLDAAVSLLRENYSKEAVRLKQGGDLTAEEQQKLNKIKDKQSELQRQLTELEGKVGKNATMLKGIQEMQKKSRQVSNCQNNLSGFLFATTALNMISGWMWGWHWWWGPWAPWAPGIYIEINEIYIDVVDVIDYDWLVLDDYIDVAEWELEVDIEDFELEAMDDYLLEADFDMTPDDFQDFSIDELNFEGEMDIIEMDDFQDFDFGDFDGGFDGFDDF